MMVIWYCYDLMAGRLGGVLPNMKIHYPYVPYIHYKTHMLHLIVVYICKNVNVSADLLNFKLITNLFLKKWVFFKYTKQKGFITRKIAKQW